MEMIAEILKELDELAGEYRRRVKAGESDLPIEYLIGTFSDSKQGSLHKRH